MKEGLVSDLKLEYPTSNPTLLDTGLEVPLNGEMVYFNYYWLRDNCGSSWDEVTQERSFDIVAEPDHLKASLASLDETYLYITWPDGHVSRYSLNWLANWVKHQGHEDLANRHRKPWYNDHYSNLARFDYLALMQDPIHVADWTEKLIDEGISLVKNVPPTNKALKALCELIGVVRSSFSGYTFDVHSKKTPENLAYTSQALELHTDLPPEELAPGIQFLHCKVNDAEGGDSLFVDAVSVAAALKEEHLDYFETLVRDKVPFRYTTTRHDARSRQYVIEIDPDNGEVSGINFSLHLSDIFDLPQKELDLFYPAFRKFGQMMQDPRYLMRFRLNAGECIVFDNHRVAHGRAAFKEGSGERRLRGCYVARGDLRSTYRVLRAKYPIGGILY